MKELTVYENKRNNQYHWAWVDEFTGEKTGDTYLTKTEALNNQPDNSDGDYYTYRVKTI